MCAKRVLPAQVGEDASKRSRSRGAIRTSAVRTTDGTKELASEQIKGGGAPVGATVSEPHHASRCCHLHALRMRRAPHKRMLPTACASGALASRRSTAVSQPQAAFPGITGCKREDPPRCQCSELLTVRHVPDERGPEAARERFARPRAGTAPAPHLRIASGMRPSMGGLIAHLLDLRRVSRTHEIARGHIRKRLKIRRFCARWRSFCEAAGSRRPRDCTS